MKSSGKSFLFYCAFLAFSEVFCRLTRKVEDVEAKVGSTAYLNCSSDDQSGKELRWFHYRVGDPERHYVYAWKSLVPPYNARFRIMDLDPATGALNIVISKVEASDAGRYLCWEREEEGETSEAELVVLESDPICNSNVNLDQLIGENSCEMKPDAVELTCSVVGYRGNRAPRLKWRRADRPDEALMQRFDPTGGVASTNLTASVTLSGASFVCEAQHSVSPGLVRCNSSIATVLHALENRTEIHVDHNADVLCEAHTNCQSCSYAWYNDLRQQVSTTQNMTVRRLGSHQCKAKCRMRNRDCEIVAKQIYVNPPSTPYPPPPPPTPPPDPSLWFFTLLVFVVFAAVLILVYVHYQKHKERIDIQIAELKKILNARHPEMISYRDNPILMRVIEGKSSSSSSSPTDQQQSQCKIRGVTVHGASVFVVYSKTSEIQELDSESYEEKRFFDVSGLVNPWDVVSSPSNNYLYVMDGRDEESDAKAIFQIYSSGRVKSIWTTKRDAGYLSVTAPEGKVILAVFKKNRLKVFSPDGDLLQTVRVSATGGRIIHPHHAFKFGTDHYLLIHGVGDSLHRVCIVDDQGSTIKTFGGRKGKTDAQMNLPKYLAVDRSGSVMVLDQNNNRVLLLNYDLGFQKVLIASDKGLENPSKIHLDEKNGRLLIAEEGRIHVFSVLQMANSNRPLDVV